MDCAAGSRQSHRRQALGTQSHHTQLLPRQEATPSVRVREDACGFVARLAAFFTAQRKMTPPAGRHTYGRHFCEGMRRGGVLRAPRGAEKFHITSTRITQRPFLRLGCHSPGACGAAGVLGCAAAVVPTRSQCMQRTPSYAVRGAWWWSELV